MFIACLYIVYCCLSRTENGSANGKTRKISAPANAGRAVVYPARFVANLDFGLKKPYTISNYSGCNIRYSTKYCEESA